MIGPGRVLVTGGDGFIGRHLVRALVARGDDVIVLDSHEEQVHPGDVSRLPGRQPFMGNPVYFTGDVGHPGAVALAMEGVDRVVHLAAVVGVGQSMYQFANYVQKNSLATASFLEAVVAQRPRIERLIVASSMSVYGEGAKECRACDHPSPGPRSPERLAAGQWGVPCVSCGKDMQAMSSDETDRLNPTSVYAITKRDQEELCLTVGAAYDIPTLALRFFNVYGPGQSLSNPYTGAAAIFASRLLNGKPPIVFEDGEQERDFIHVSDIVRGILLALDATDVSERAINLGTGRPTQIRRIAHILADVLAPDINPVYTNEYRTGDIRHCFADTWAAETQLCFVADTPVDIGIRELAADIRGRTPNDTLEAHISDLRTSGLLQ